MPRRLTIDEIRPVFEAAGARLLATTYTKNTHPLDFLCQCGTPHRVSWQLLQRGSKPWCEVCRTKHHDSQVRLLNGLDPTKLVERLAEDGATYIEGTYTNNRTPFQFTCACGQIGQMRWDGNHLVFARCADCSFKGRIRGEAHHLWNPNLTEEERQNRDRGVPFTIWCRRVLRLADFTCIITGRRGATMAAHHIYNWAHYPEHRFLLSNGVCIERELHEEFHHIYGRGNNTLDQFKQFFLHHTGEEFTRSIQP